MGVEKDRYDALTELYDGGSPAPVAFGPLPPNGSENQRALGAACWYRHRPNRELRAGGDGKTVRDWILHFYGSQLAKGMWIHEPNSSEYHHLHSAASWAIYDAALDDGDREVARVLRRWLRNDLAISILFAVHQDGTLRVAVPGARTSRLQSLSRNIQLQQALGRPLERRPGHPWWSYRERRESLGVTIHAARGLPLLNAEEKDGAERWLRDRELTPALKALLAPVRYKDPLHVVDTDRGWYSFFPQLTDCWDNAQPAVAVEARIVRYLRARDDAGKRHFWHTSPVTCGLEGGRLVASGHGHRGQPPTTLWRDELEIPAGPVTRRLVLGPDGVRLDDVLLEVPSLDDGVSGGPGTGGPPAIRPMAPEAENLVAELGGLIGERRALESQAGKNAEIARRRDRQREILDTLRAALGL